MNAKQKEVFKQDRITKAVDMFNETLKDLGVCVGEVNYNNCITQEQAYLTAIYCDKLVERTTFKKLVELEEK